MHNIVGPFADASTVCADLRLVLSDRRVGTLLSDVVEPLLMQWLALRRSHGDSNGRLRWDRFGWSFAAPTCNDICRSGVAGFVRVVAGRPRVGYRPPSNRLTLSTRATITAQHALKNENYNGSLGAAE